MGRLFPIARVAAFLALLAGPAGAHDARWTAIIPQAFPGIVYSWSLAPGGSYREEGHSGVNGAAVQSTMSGRWNRNGSHLVLRQDAIPYVFDGTVEGSRYSGTLYLQGRPLSQFCAAADTAPPKHCDAPSV